MSHWQQPPGNGPIHVYNSLTRSKVPFNPTGETITWYTCGPTVYDASHMGHARNYIGFDVIRRVLRDYFGHQIFLVMNVTNIDDKIILRSREQNRHWLELANDWEASFMQDMRALNVEPPDALTRVSEYVPEIVAYIQKIIDNGYAYDSHGSVYFDVGAYAAKHKYGKLVPEVLNNAALLEEGEGKLSDFAAQKRSPNDFALWKKSKEDEPSWESPWGPGRPGWHIECSVMASDFLGGNFDIHSGGEDLRFPHHENEMAQAEAYHENQQWVNYFLHSGHLHIEGLKMSKSLKNFITIKETLKRYHGRQLRLLFLTHHYDLVMNYSEDAMQAIVEKDRQFSDFFQTINSLLRSTLENLKSNQRWGPGEKALSDETAATKKVVHAALVDNFDTPTVITALDRLKGAVYKYLEDHKEHPSPLVVRTAASYISYMFRVLGLIDTEIGFGAGTQELAPILDTLAQFRDQVRDVSRSDKEEKRKIGEILSLSDALRDHILPELGIKLEDRVGEPSIWKVYAPEELALYRQQKAQAEAAKRKKAQEAAARQQAEDLKNSVPPQEFFSRQPDYAGFRFDEQGIPSHDPAGKEVPARTRDKLKKVQASHAKKHEAWKAKQPPPAQ
jgi:cysteinyl-tRNA synthetase